MSEISCRKCKKGTEKEVELHHLVPKCFFKDKQDADKYTRKYLCTKCHNIILGKTMSFIFWNFVSDKNKCKEEVEQYNLRWISKEEKNDTTI